MGKQSQRGTNISTKYSSIFSQRSIKLSLIWSIYSYQTLRQFPPNPNPPIPSSPLFRYEFDRKTNIKHCIKFLNSLRFKAGRIKNISPPFQEK